MVKTINIQGNSELDNALAKITKLQMYRDIHTNASETVKIMGWPFYAENITGDEPYNRREREFTSILGGTERVSKGKYVHREYSFTTTVFFPTGKPHAYDKIFEKMMSGEVEVISRYMGGKFNALIKINQSFPENSPNHMELDITVTEVPKTKSNIPGEKFIVPRNKKIIIKGRKEIDKALSTTLKVKSKSKRKSIKKKNK